MLALVAGGDQDNEGWSDEVLLPVADGRTTRYCDWWHEQAVEQDNHILFSVRLIGDASSPQLYTLMAHTDLRIAASGATTQLWNIKQPEHPAV
ncbi:hypothetical protein ABBQ32_011275 [Trebouxia sp. C0010 RCD-2024]